MLQPAQPCRCDRCYGFTLVELLIVIAVILVIAAVALPGMLSSKITTNESSAIQTLRTIAASQTAFKARRVVDNEATPDGEGEFGYMAEMAGVAPLRGSAAVLQPPTTSPRLGGVQASVVSSSGYYFAVFLPGPGGAGVAEDAAGGKAAAGAIDASLAERLWVAYAWPINLGTSGNRAFVTNQTGEVLITDNRSAAQQYSGLGNGPAADAAYTGPGNMALPFALSGAAADGGNWRPLR